MRCKACDVILEDNELVKKDKNGDYFDMCNNCLSIVLSAEWELENSCNITEIDSEGLTLDDLYDTLNT